ncbi:hypothetical protein RIVM261_032780 [Rivularia sp. IAM M-261]|nr:hypothetical protein CAL7716_092650 [Calothrix sp. PCC 7716]GJD18322.1 hypothetical protein RIVM261_032780 [Rivularia sp. IAM M-261]
MPQLLTYQQAKQSSLLLTSEFKLWDVAEYSGAICGLKKADELGCKQIKLFGDSQLVIILEDSYLNIALVFQIFID